jgi:hypothetical protein
VLNAESALGAIPATLRQELLDEFEKITRNYREGRWESTELDGGRLCEIIYTILKGHVDGAYPAKASKPSRFKDACEQLANADGNRYPESVRMAMPRVLIALYDVRNRRGVGHVGGDVNPNHMDSALVLSMAKWLMAELVRLFHQTDVATSTTVVEALVDRTVPIVWEVDGLKRVLDVSLKLADQTRILLYSSPQGLTDRQLAEYLEQKRMANYRRVLEPLHKGRMIEWSQATGLVKLSPKGVADVEKRLLGISSL